MDANEYQRWVTTKIKSGRTFREHVTNFAMGLASETGEINEAYKQNLFHGHNLDEENLKKEFGDLLWYISALAILHGWTLEEIMQRNMDKLNARYPNGFREEDSLNRDTSKE